MNCSGHGTSLALETNRVDIDPELKDAWGIPAIRVTYKDHPDDLKHADLAGAIAPWRSWTRRARRDRAGRGRRGKAAASICWVPAAWAMTRTPRWSTSITARMM